MLASRSDYFKALLDHAAAEAADRDDTQSSAVSPAHDANAEVFCFWLMSDTAWPLGHPHLIVNLRTTLSM